MKEDLFFFEMDSLSKKRILVNSFISDNKANRAFLYLNPVLDEKTKVQRFQNESARLLCENYHIFRFDYSGTGDSDGYSFEFMANEIYNTIDILSNYIVDKYNVAAITLLGIRIGADFALHYSHNKSLIDKLVLVEPVLEGKKFLIEQRIRRKMHKKLNNIKNQSDTIVIKNIEYEDFQGYPFSNESIQFINNISLKKVEMENKDIYIYNLNNSYSKKNLKQLINKLGKNNTIQYKLINGHEFWSSLEHVDSYAFTKEIIRSFIN